MTPAAPSRDRTPWLVFFFFLALYLVTFGGHPYTGDGLEMLKTAESLALRGDLAVTSDSDGRAWGYPGADGRRYSPYAIGLSLAEAPPLGLAHAAARALGLSPIGTDSASFGAAVAVNVAVTAATAALLCALVLALGLGRRAATGASLLYGLATMAWVYSKHDFAEPLAALALLATAHFLLRAGGDGRGRSFAAAGAWNGVGFLTKYQMVLYTPILLGALIVRERRKGSSPRAIVSRALWFLLPGLPFGLVDLWVNHARFGTWLETGYGNQGAIVAGAGFIPVGLFGLLLSAGKGVIWYSPIVVLAPFAWRAFHRLRPEASGLCLALIGTTIAIFAPLWWWHGDWSWGPRYLVVVLPEMIVPLAVWLRDRAALSRRLAPRVTLGGVVAALVVLAIAVNLLGISFNFVYYLLELRTMQKVHDDWNFIPNLSPIRFHAHLARATLLGALGGEVPDFTYASWCDGVLTEKRISMASYPPSGLEPDYFFFRRRASSTARAGLSLAGGILAATAFLLGAHLRRAMAPEEA
ncbi:MAG: glycosyltransferase family 39 protein [Acidobacteria bacterium]|nr:glycosyltransferase family 39 protein [Acidobacteriota bacterium]